MRIRFSLPGLLGCVVVPVAVGAACQEPTQVLFEAYTDVPASPSRQVAFWIGAPGNIDSGEPVTVTSTPWGADGFVGSLVAAPGDAKDASLAARVVLGVDRDPTTCSATDSAGCIVARRRLSYVPNTRVRVPVDIFASCTGVFCTEDTTCNALGRCVSATIDPNACDRPQGCRLPGDPAVVGVNGGGLLPP